MSVAFLWMKKNVKILYFYVHPSHFFTFFMHDWYIFYVFNTLFATICLGEAVLIGLGISTWNLFWPKVRHFKHYLTTEKKRRFDTSHLIGYEASVKKTAEFAKIKKDSHFSMPRLPSDSTSTTTKKEGRAERQEQIELFCSSLSLQYKRQNSTELPTTMKTIRQFLPTKPTASRTMTEKKAAGNTKATIVFYCWIAVIVTMATTTVPEVQ